VGEQLAEVARLTWARNRRTLRPIRGAMQVMLRSRCWLWWPLARGRGSLIFLDGAHIELEIVGRGRAVWRHAGTGKRLAWVVAAEA